MARRFEARRRPVNRHWSAMISQTLGQSSGNIATNVAAVAVVHTTETILRIRGSLTAWIDGAQAPGGAIRVTVGLHRVPEGTGTTILADPQSDADAPWIYYTSFILAYEEMVTDVVDVAGTTSFREVVDNKSMRIIRPDQELQMVWSNVTVGGAMSFNAEFNGRVLTQE